MFKRLLFLPTVFFLVLAVSVWTAPPALAQAVPPQTLLTPLNPKTIPQFAQALPLLGTIQVLDARTANKSPSILMCEFDANILPPGTPLVGNAALTTRVWGYYWDSAGTGCPASPRATYIGPVIVASRSYFPVGGTIVDNSIAVKWVNELGTVNTGVVATDTKVRFYTYSIDQTLHWADPTGVLANGVAESNVCAETGGVPAFGSPCAQNYSGPIPAVVHLHGGEVPPVLDGGPDAWFTSDGSKIGHGYYSKDNLTAKNYAIYDYPNGAEPANIWFHDHVLGITRLNVYAGLAGAYIITESDANKLPPADLNDPTKIIPLVIQDRMFDTNGQLFFPGDSAGNLLWSPNPQHPYWVPEFVGDTIVVNGKVWPFLQVNPNRYRFLFVNGSNARTYVLNIPGGPKMYVIGTDGGYLDKPVPINTLTIMPGERYDVVIDFTGLKGKFTMNNSGKTPFPRGAQPAGATLGRIMQFQVVTTATGVVPLTYNPAGATPAIRGGTNQPPLMVRLPGTPLGLPIDPTLSTGNVQAFRQLTLNEVLMLPQTVVDPVTGVLKAFPGGPLEILLNNTKWTGKRPNPNHTPIPGYTPFPNGVTNPPPTGQIWYSELPNEGDTELWEIINLTADAHPIHLHLVQFQVVNRQSFNTGSYLKAYAAAFPGDATIPACIAGVVCEGWGPPGDYFTEKNCGLTNPRVLGGNPCVDLHLQGAVQLPALQEQGWKDTVISYPGQVLRLMVRWAPMDLPATTAPSAAYFPFDPDSGHGYVWHCHIIDHEDNEMMRPTQVQGLTPAPTRTYIKGTNY